MKKQTWSRGQTMVEYALLLASVAVVVVVAYSSLGNAVSAALATVNTAL